MPKVGVDLSSIEQFEALPPGKYECIIESVTYIAESKASKQPNLKWQLAVAEGEFENRKLFMNTSLVPKALWKLQQVFEGLGLPHDTKVDIDYDEDTNELIEPNLIGLACLCDVGVQQIPGTKRSSNTVDSIIGSNALSSTAGNNKKGGRKYQ